MAKKLTLIMSMAISSLLLSACSTPTQQSSVPMDMKAVQEYQQRVASGNTVSPTAKEDAQELNQSDKAQKVKVYYHMPRRLHPSLYYQGGYGLGMGLGYY